MLAPDQRELFLDALRAPDGYRFDRGIGTTFSLDLLTLLVAPLSLALLDVSDSAAALSDPVILLEGLRRYADRITIFCQAGRIAIPPPDNYLYSFLENSIVEVQAPRDGVFHPKIWVLRYIAEAEEEPPLYRLLNLSRNLTFDKSWDLMLRLEGQLAIHRTLAYGTNNALGDFIQALPRLALREVDSRVADDIAVLQDEVRRAAFEVPWPFLEDSLGFYPSGITGLPGYRFNQSHYRAMVVSPFLSDRLLRQVTETGEGHVLISRADSIAALKVETLDRFEKVYVLDEGGIAEVEAAVSEGVGEEIAGAKAEPSGLHAKLYILEAGWDAIWLQGSANATNAAFRRKNVEFLVKLQGRKSKVGIDSVLGVEGDENALLSLLRPYRPRAETTSDEREKRAEALADSVRNWLLGLGMQLDVIKQDIDRFDLLLMHGQIDTDAPEGDYTITCWPVTLRPERKVELDSESKSTPLKFPSLSLLALMPFIAFEVMAQVDGHRHTLRFALNLPISGIPETRQDHLYSAIISDRAQFLRYLWLIFAGEDGGLPLWADWIAETPGRLWRTGFGGDDFPLLEVLMRALSRSPDKIDRVAELVERLRRTPQGRDVLPEGFEPFWEAVMRIRGEML